MDVLYTKFNTDRVPEFQTSITVYEEGGKLYCVKKALHKEGREHIKRIAENTDPKQKIISSDDDSVALEYINGPTVRQLLMEAAANGDKNAFFGVLDRYKTYISGKETVAEKLFHAAAEFKKVFGRPLSAMENVECLVNANLDLTFDNIIISEDNEWIAFDNEWVFDFKIPVKYIVFRAARNFYYRCSKFIDICELYAYFCITNEEAEIFLSFEDNLHRYVFGNAENNVNKENVVLYGAGFYGEKALDYYGSHRVFAFADINKAGTEYLGKPVIHPSSLPGLCNDYDIVICVKEYSGVVDYLRSMGIATIRLLPLITKGFRIMLPANVM